MWIYVFLCFIQLFYVGLENFVSLDIATLRCYTSIFDGFIYSDFGRLSGLEKSSLALILFDGISLKRGKKG